LAITHSQIAEPDCVLVGRLIVNLCAPPLTPRYQSITLQGTSKNGAGPAAANLTR